MEETIRNKKPLYDARAKYTDLLVDTIKETKDYMKMDLWDKAFRSMITYFYLTKSHINPKQTEKIVSLINEASNKATDYNVLGLDSEQIIMSYVDRIFPNILSLTAHLLLPTQESDDDIEEDDL